MSIKEVYDQQLMFLQYKLIKMTDSTCKKKIGIRLLKGLWSSNTSLIITAHMIMHVQLLLSNQYIFLESDYVLKKQNVYFRFNKDLILIDTKMWHIGMSHHHYQWMVSCLPFSTFIAHTIFSSFLIYSFVAQIKLS